MKKARKAVLKSFILFNIKYNGIKAKSVNTGHPKRYISLGIASESNNPEKTEEKITCKINSIILLF